MEIEDDSKFEQVARRDREELLAKEEAIGVVGSIITEVYMRSSNDTELPELDQIMKLLKSGDMKPETAKQRARAILASKMDYH